MLSLPPVAHAGWCCCFQYLHRFATRDYATVGGCVKNLNILANGMSEWVVSCCLCSL